MDVERFSNRTNLHQLAVRAGFYRVLQAAFAESGIPWAECHREDRGDGVLVLAPVGVVKGPFVESLPGALVKALREHNASHAAEEQIRLRMALHAGQVHHDEHGVAAASINLAFRLLAANQLRAVLANSPGVLALITSEWFYDDVVRHSPAGNPGAYRRVRVSAKETTTDAWITLPDQPDPPSVPAVADRSATVPRQLPAPPAHFVGRAEELKQLDTSDTVVISAINGTAGIGKTALALHWAHQTTDRFPDGQLYVNLRGFDPTGAPMLPAEAIRGFLDAFEIPPERIPVNLEAQAALYRSLLADRHVLVLLDNARDTKQVRPLLPGSPSCLAVITSRNQLAGLVAQEGARPITLDVLDQDEAVSLLAGRLGHDRVHAEPDAVAELIERCARLPLALAIVAARAALHPDFPLGTLAGELRDDPVTGVRAVFSWSYTALPAGAARLFRLLGLHPGPDLDLHAAASLAGVPTSQARPLLADLTSAHLLEEHIPGRFRFHDLLRAYAAERAADEEPEPQRREAVHRVLDYYLHTGFAADRHLDPPREPITLPAAVAGVSPHSITGYQMAMDWFAAEHANLLAATHHAARTALDTHAWQLPWTLTTFFDARGHWHDFAASQQIALAAARRLGDRGVQARTHRNLGKAYALLRCHDDALGQLQQALSLYRELGDRTGQARSHHALSWVCELQGKYAEALTHGQHTLKLFRADGNQSGEAQALNGLGWNHALLGRYAEALTHCQQALDLLRQLGERDGEAASLDSLGFAYHHLGQHKQAITHYQQSLALWRELGYRFFVADTLTHLGDAHHAAGDRPAAGEAWRQALAIFEDLDHPDAGQVRAKLTELNQP